MAKTNSESGHVVVLGNFDTAITRIVGIGPDFLPNHPSLQLDAMRLYKGRCGTAHGAVKDALEIYHAAVAARKTEYGKLAKHSTRIVNAFAETSASAADVEQLRAIKRLISGNRPAPPAGNATGEEADNKHSTSQRSFIRLADHLDGVIRACKANPGYNPVDDDLKIPALLAYHQSLLDTNTSVDTAFSDLQAARKKRNELFYDAESGIPAVAERLRNHLRSRGDGQKDLLKGLRFPNLG